MQITDKLRGSIVALVTPMFPDGQIDLESWKRLLDWHIKAGTSGIVVAGTTGESACLDNSEVGALLDVAVEYFSPYGPVLSGVGSPSTVKSIELAALAAERGANAVLAVTPYYNRPPQSGLLLHYRQLAKHSSLPVVLYNVPTRTSVDLLPETTAELAQVENITGLKEANNASDRLPELMRNLSVNNQDDFILLSGDDDSCSSSMLAGMQGVISVASNIVPAAMQKLCRLSLDGDAEAAAFYEQKLKPLFAMLSWEGNPIAIKWCLHQQGMLRAGIRQPLPWLNEKLQARAVPILAEAMQLETDALHAS